MNEQEMAVKLAEVDARSKSNTQFTSNRTSNNKASRFWSYYHIYLFILSIIN